MALPIKYSLRARNEEIQILDYIVSNFGKSKAKKIYNRIEMVIDLISRNPEMFPESKIQKGLRKCVFSKQTSIYYRINNGYLEIVSFRPNRKDPKKFKI